MEAKYASFWNPNYVLLYEEFASKMESGGNSAEERERGAGLKESSVQLGKELGGGVRVQCDLLCFVGQKPQ